MDASPSTAGGPTNIHNQAGDVGRLFEREDNTSLRRVKIKRLLYSDATTTTAPDSTRTSAPCFLPSSSVVLLTVPVAMLVLNARHRAPSVCVLHWQD